MKEMMKILTENKRKEQLRRKESKRVREHALDIFKSIWLIIAFIVFVELISLI